MRKQDLRNINDRGRLVGCKLLNFDVHLRTLIETRITGGGGGGR